MIFTNARVILGDRIAEDVDVIVANGKIEQLTGLGGSGRPATVDVRGNYLAPGFVDLHLHGAVGRDTMEASAEGFRAICDYHASGGTTSLLLTTATAPIEQIVQVLAEVRASAKSIPQLCGVHVEGPFISPERAGAQRDQFIRNPDSSSTAQLLEYADVIKRVTLAPELPGALELIQHLR